MTPRCIALGFSSNCDNLLSTVYFQVGISYFLFFAQKCEYDTEIRDFFFIWGILIVNYDLYCRKIKINSSVFRIFYEKEGFCSTRYHTLPE